MHYDILNYQRRIVVWIPWCCHHIRRAAEMIDDLHYTRPNTQLVIPAIFRRYDDPDLSDVYRDKIERVNIFQEHKCKKNPKFHFLRHDFCFVDFRTDWLHFNQAGVEKYAASIEAVKRWIMIMNRCLSAYWPIHETTCWNVIIWQMITVIYDFFPGISTVLAMRWDIVKSMLSPNHMTLLRSQKLW